jgi:hypothetical protein
MGGVPARVTMYTVLRDKGRYTVGGADGLCSFITGNPAHDICLSRQKHGSRYSRYKVKCSVAMETREFRRRFPGNEGENPHSFINQRYRGNGTFRLCR